MMTLNYNEKDFQKKLQKDIEMPEIVHEHINQAYRLIENNAVLQKKASKDPYHWMKSGGRIAGGMAAVLAVGFVFCAINPVMAKNKGTALLARTNISPCALLLGKETCRNTTKIAATILKHSIA